MNIISGILRGFQKYRYSHKAWLTCDPNRFVYVYSSDNMMVTGHPCEILKESFFHWSCRKDNKPGHLWTIDCRYALTTRQTLDSLAEFLITRLFQVDTYQIAAAKPFLNYLLLAVMSQFHETGKDCAILTLQRSSTSTDPEWSTIGRIEKEKQILVIDDVLQSGITCMNTINNLRNLGFSSVNYLCLFEIEGTQGRIRLEQNEVQIISICRIIDKTRHKMK